MFAELHTHTDRGSNARLIDSMCQVNKLIDKAIELGHRGIAITDHESLSSHIKAIKKVKEIQKTNPSFRLVLGNEIYLINESDYQETKKFWHFILLAKDKVGHHQLRELSSRAWSRIYRTGLMERVPTFYSDIAEVVGNNAGHLIASTACLGSYFDALILEDRDDDAYKFVRWCQTVFGADSFYIELQPGITEEQITYNQRAIQFCKQHGLEWIITNDVHYLTKDKQQLHAAFLNSKDEERETESFYESTYLKTEQEMIERMSYLDEADIKHGFANTVRIAESIEQYDLAQEVDIPKRQWGEFQLQHIFKDWYDKYPFIKEFAYSDEIQNQYCLYQCERGFLEKNQPFDDLHIGRINIEFEQLSRITEKLHKCMAAYYNLAQWLVDIMWADDKGNSIVGPGRGSAAGFYLCYLLNITQVNPLRWNLPWWRHLHHLRPELPDIDIDTCAAKRPQIFAATKREWGENKALNIITFRTAKPKAAIKTACRGLGIDTDVANELAGMIPIVRGNARSIQSCLFGEEATEDNPAQPPLQSFVELVSQYPNLQETVLEIADLVVGRGSHASGLYLFNQHYLEQNSLMKSPKGIETTCWDQEDSDYVGALKMDYLTVEGIDRIQKCMMSLVQANKIDWKGTLRNTYNAYFHADVLEYDAPEMWDLLADGAVMDVFQFQTQMGVEAVKKIKPRSLKEMALSSSVMRLMGDSGINPMDKFVAFRNNPHLWVEEMEKAGLTQSEQNVLHQLLDENAGCSIEQEDVMRISMDEHIAGFDIVGAHKVRKVIAKKKNDQIEGIKKKLFDAGHEHGARDVFLNYVWDYCIKPQLGYSFSQNHTTAYAIIALLEMNLVYRFPPVYWNTACLTVGASADEDVEDSKSTNYGKIARAIGTIQSRGVVVTTPNINTSSFEFLPDEEHDRIVFGIKGIQDVGDDAVRQIVDNRPYTSISDFWEKNGNLSVNAVIALIKAGCFDEFGVGDTDEARRKNAMQQFLKLYTLQKVEPKTKLTMANWNALEQLSCIPEEFEGAQRLLKFQKYALDKKFKNEELSAGMKTGGWYTLDKVAQTYFEDNLARKLESPAQYREIDGEIVVLQKALNGCVKQETVAVKEWLADEKTVRMFNVKAMNHYAQNIWINKCQGNISHWEMGALSFYAHEHELARLNVAQYQLSKWSDIPEEPVVSGTVGKGKYPKYKLYTIVGTVLDRNNARHMVDLLTPDGVVTIKFWADNFNKYAKQTSVINEETGDKTTTDKSWFLRGNLLIITGYRRGDMFYPKKYYDSVQPDAVGLIGAVSHDGTQILDVRYSRT